MVSRITRQAGRFCQNTALQIRLSDTRSCCAHYFPVSPYPAPWHRRDIAPGPDREAARIKMHWQPLYWHIRRSHIERDIQTYADLFGNDLLILDYDDLQDPNKVLARVARFLEVPVQPLLGQSEYNTTLLPRNRLVAALYRNAGLRDTLRNLVPVPLRSRLRALGHTTRPVQVSEKEKHLVLTLLKDEIAACITNPLIPTQNWRSAQALDACTATQTHSLLKKWRKNALGS